MHVEPLYSMFIARRLIAVCEHSFCGDVGVCIIIDSTFGCICPDGDITDRCTSDSDLGYGKVMTTREKRKPNESFAWFTFQCRTVTNALTMVSAINTPALVYVPAVSQAHNVNP